MSKLLEEVSEIKESLNYCLLDSFIGLQLEMADCKHGKPCMERVLQHRKGRGHKLEEVWNINELGLFFKLDKILDKDLDRKKNLKDKKN